MALCAAMLAACGAASAPSISLDRLNPHQAVVTVTGLSRRDAAALTDVVLSREAWQSVLRVSVKTADGGPAPLPVAGSYDVRNGVIRFMPHVPLEPPRAARARPPLPGHLHARGAAGRRARAPAIDLARGGPAGSSRQSTDQRGHGVSVGTRGPGEPVAHVRRVLRADGDSVGRELRR